MLLLEHVICEILIMIVGEFLLNKRVVFRFGTNHFVEESLHRITMLSSKLDWVTFESGRGHLQ